jgi:predicted unusual protein kinase regulating ubiquinone biosynthesis (AarF/ABC1/UbiB family)
VGQYQPTQLKLYNPDAIARYYSYRPWLAWGRLLRIISSFAVFIISLKWDEWLDKVEQNKVKRAIQLRELLLKLVKPSPPDLT